jgi:hypothetical protein
MRLQPAFTARDQRGPSTRAARPPCKAGMVRVKARDGDSYRLCSLDARSASHDISTDLNGQACQKDRGTLNKFSNLGHNQLARPPGTYRRGSLKPGCPSRPEPHHHAVRKDEHPTKRIPARAKRRAAKLGSVSLVSALTRWLAYAQPSKHAAPVCSICCPIAPISDVH